MYKPTHTISVDPSQVSVKSDDALVPSQLWDDHIWNQVSVNSSRIDSYQRRYGGLTPLDAIQKFGIRYWWRTVLRSLVMYLRQTYGASWNRDPAAARDRTVGADCIWRTTTATWWEWSQGSTLFFWRWPVACREIARDGFPLWVQGPLPSYRVPQRRESDPTIRTQVSNKLISVRSRRYIVPGSVHSLTNYFAVPKGPSDIRMVYDASRSGLNRALWVPSFPLPTADSLTDLLDEDSWMADIDMGEMFLNFPLDMNIRQFCGVDLKPYFLKEAGPKTLWERWEQCVMGLRPSPYVTTKCVALADEMAFGDRKDPSNPFHWATVHLNLPGDPSYSPTAPWVSRQTKDGALAGGIVKYIDDIRPVACGSEACWHLAHTIACRYTYLGLQIATRKFRPPSQSPGAWAGVIAVVSQLGISLQCSQEKWDKAK